MTYVGRLKMHCCKIGCSEAAEYEIWNGPQSDDYIHSCLAHIPDLMTDAAEHRIIRLSPVKNPKWPDRVTSSTTECAHDKCPDQARCRNGCVDQKSITWSNQPTPQ
jgi:hypothetical protein